MPKRDFKLARSMPSHVRRESITVSLLAPSEKDMEKVVRMADYLRYHPEATTVPDPYYGGDKGFELVIELLEDACRELYLQQVGDDHITNI